MAIFHSYVSLPEGISQVASIKPDKELCLEVEHLKPYIIIYIHYNAQLTCSKIMIIL